jgi:hypothetical protein
VRTEGFDVSDLLYKVSEPRVDPTFEPRRFWRAEDWSFSDDQEHEDLVEDRVVYAGSFDEINIHLFPRVWRLRVWLDHEGRCGRLRGLGYSWAEGSKALIFALESDRDSIESFSPTVFAFDRSGFEQTPTDEFVSREARTAVSAETLRFREALRRWRFDVVYVSDADVLVEALRSGGVDHQIQT